MADQLSIANRSLLAVGARTQISSLNPSDGSVEANSVSILYTPTFEQLGRAAHWNCLGREIVLSLLQAAQGTPENPNGGTYNQPPYPWLYSYAYPSDCLDVRYISPSNPLGTSSGTVQQTSINNAIGPWVPGGGQIPYKVQTILDVNNAPVTVILTNQSQANLIYTVNQPNPAGWDSLFQEAMVAALGAFLVPALSLDLPLMDRCIAQAEKAIKIARTADGNEGVTTMDHLPDWMQARAGAQGMGLGFNSFYTNGFLCYSNMAWPGGSSYGD